MNEHVTGRCLCGEVTFTVATDFQQFYLCHCQQCRQITGAPYAANLLTKPDSITWLSGESLLRRYDYPGRSFSKVFCSQCGSGLPFITQSGKTLIVPAGSLNEQPKMQPSNNIFWEEHLDWVETSHEAKKCQHYPE
ncbi:MAG: GFA family protein [Aliiglaciecola sp.]|uniref:GFA family protein n=1 Tax=Aliiglaciecola sp. M165 TaxID=2593649 RepID=UPI00117DE30C|nr:GFA family protein [Aliiglaciecola sp. M165]TRY33132.1 GFA family protein [Aliiglaciecola sp. M165]